MSRVAAPVAKLSRAISTTAAPAAAVARNHASLLDSTTHNGGAALMPKYAELLRDREQKVCFSFDGKFSALSIIFPMLPGGQRANKNPPQSRGITTTHRPTPQPSIVNRPRPLMQTFHSSASQVAVPPTHLDAMVLPSMNFAASEPPAGPRVPLLPDNYGAAHMVPPPAPEAAFSKPTIFAAEPDRVAPSTPLSAVEGLALDGVELKFVHDAPAAADAAEPSNMIRNLWAGMVDDVLGPIPKTI